MLPTLLDRTPLFILKHHLLITHKNSDDGDGNTSRKYFSLSDDESCYYSI